jgi:hypothetical protein
MSRRDGAARVLGWSVRLLPARRQEWGRAMVAELAAIDGGRDRWRFALSCTRAVLTRPGTLLALAPRFVAAGVVVTALVLAAGIHAPTARGEAIAMVAILAAVAWLARRFFGRRSAGPVAGLVGAAGFAVVAAEMLFFIGGARQSSAGDLTPVFAVWTTMLTIYTLALVRLTAHRSAVTARTLASGAGIGLAAAAAWLATAVVHPSVPTSSAPAVAAIAAAAVCAELLSPRSRIAGLTAAAGTALLIAVLIDGPLRLLPQWVANSAPPVYAPDAPERLVDSVGVWLLGCLLAAALTLALAGPSRRRLLRAPARA